MKDSLNHLPQRKRGELARIVSIIRDSAPQAEMIIQAYIDARYHDDYKITPQELKYLARYVELLKDQTQSSCEKKMQLFI
ncbi:MAG: hypothetical protein ISS77_03860 [Phycisphaerae bacterium]|nr:hypothetical protein [Phycisphaerae bacterium]